MYVCLYVKLQGFEHDAIGSHVHVCGNIKDVQRIGIEIFSHEVSQLGFGTAGQSGNW